MPLIRGRSSGGCSGKVCHPNSVTMKWPILLIGFCQTLAGKVIPICQRWHASSYHGIVLDIFRSPLPSPPSSVPCALWGLWSQAPQLQAVVRDWRLESSDVPFPGSLSACTYLVIVIGTAAAVLWDRSCLFPQGGFIIILFIYSLLHCLFASTKSKFQEGRDHTDVFTPVSPGWLRVGAQ